MTNAPHVYICIVNWNGYARTIRCLQSLEQLDYKNWSAVVVDNASADDSVSQIRQAFPDVQIICAESNLGYAGGAELAAQRALAAGADVFWLLNNDLTVQADTLTRLVEAYLRHGEALYGSIALSSPPPERLDQFRVSYSNQLREAGYQEKPFRLRAYNLYGELFPDQEDREVACLLGSSLLIPTSVIRKFGFMDTSYFMYSEETDYCYAMRRRGVRSICVPASVVLHEEKASSNSNLRLRGIITYYQVRNRLIQIRRFESRLTFWLFVAEWLARAGVWAVRIVSRGPSSLVYVYYTLLGIRDAVLNRMGKTIAPEAYL